MSTSGVFANPADKRKLLLVIGLLVICVGWLAYFFLSQHSYGTGKAPDTPGWKVAHEINEKLIQDRSFSDVGLAVASEKPLKFTVNGGVYSQADLDHLPELLKGLRADAEYDIKVELLRR